jgi:hypothetical protein
MESNAAPKRGGVTSSPKYAERRALSQQMQAEARIVAQYGPEPLTERQAKDLDGRIRTAGEHLQHDLDNYLCLIQDAIDGRIDVALGHRTLREYFDTLPKIEITDPTERKAFVSILSGKGLSQRQIAAFTGTSAATANRDLAATVSDETVEPPVDTTTGRDGRQYKRKPKPAAEVEPEPLTVVEVEPEPDPVAVAETVVRESWSAEVESWRSDSAEYDAVDGLVQKVCDQLAGMTKVVAALRQQPLFTDDHFRAIRITLYALKNELGA